MMAEFAALMSAALKGSVAAPPIPTMVCTSVRVTDVDVPPVITPTPVNEKVLLAALGVLAVSA